jgi:hypothetical protein
LYGFVCNRMRREREREREREKGIKIKDRRSKRKQYYSNLFRYTPLSPCTSIQ